MDRVYLLVLEGRITQMPEFERTAYGNVKDALQAAVWWKEHGVKVLDLIELAIDNGTTHVQSLVMML